MPQFTLRAPEDAKKMVQFVKAHAGQQAALGKPLVVSIQEWKQKRTADQNRCLHAVLQAISEQAVIEGRQFSLEAWKEEVRVRFIGSEELDLPNGTRIERGISTTALSVGEFANLIEAVSAWAQTELNVDL